MDVKILGIKVKKQEVILIKEQFKALDKLKNWYNFIKKIGSAQITRLELVLKMLSREKYLFKVKNKDGAISKNTAIEIVIFLRLQANMLLEIFK